MRLSRKAETAIWHRTRHHPSPPGPPFATIGVDTSETGRDAALLGDCRSNGNAAITNESKPSIESGSQGGNG